VKARQGQNDDGDHEYRRQGATDVVQQHRQERREPDQEDTCYLTRSGEISGCRRVIGNATSMAPKSTPEPSSMPVSKMISVPERAPAS